MDRRSVLPPDVIERGAPRAVAVVGAGITGLVTAYELKRRGMPVTVFEATGIPGGAIGTSIADGFLAEHGPNSFVTSAPVEALIADLGLDADVVNANPIANRRYVVRDGKLVPFPLSPFAMLTTPLLSTRAKLRVLLEPLVSARDSTDDESVGAFVRRRLGAEVLDYAVNPFIAGIFAGDPDRLSMEHAFPRVAALEREHGSLSMGLVRTRRAARAARKAPRLTARAGGDDGAPLSSGAPADATAEHGVAPVLPRLISFRDGLQMLPDALADALGNTLRLNTPVRLVHRDNDRWIVESGSDGSVRAQAVDAIVFATPAYRLAAMELPAALRELSHVVEQVEYPPVSCLTLGFRRADVAHPLDGFGVLVPAAEKRRLLGALFTSTLFPERAPEGHVAITVFVGGDRNPDLAQSATDTLVTLVTDELRQLLGIRGEAVFTKHVYWPRAIPQYSVGFGRVKEAVETIQRANPGLYLAGNYNNGVSVGDCIAGGRSVAEEVAGYLAGVE